MQKALFFTSVSLTNDAAAAYCVLFAPTSPPPRSPPVGPIETIFSWFVLKCMDRNQRYEQAVNKVARRMLPALSRSYFSSTVNAEDVAAAEVRSLLDRAWLSRISELFEDPCKGDLGLDLAPASGASSSSAGDEVSRRNPDCSADGVRVRPWHVAKDLLKMHVLACRVSEGEDTEVSPLAVVQGFMERHQLRSPPMSVCPPAVPTQAA